MALTTCQKPEVGGNTTRLNMSSGQRSFDERDFSRGLDNKLLDEIPTRLDTLAITFENAGTLKEDENRNSIFVENELSSIAQPEFDEGVPPDNKTKAKKTSKFNSLKNLVKVSVSNTPPVELYKVDQREESHPELKQRGILTIKAKDRSRNAAVSGSGRTSSRSVNKSYRRRRNRKSQAIQNEGAPLWMPVVETQWKSAGGRLVNLEDISLNLLCDAERATLKQFAVEVLRSYGLGCQIIVPKEHRASSRRRWKDFLPLGKKTRAEGRDKEKESARPANPVFSISLYQVIENEKVHTLEHARQMDMLISDARSSEQNFTIGQDSTSDSRQTSKEEFRGSSGKIIRNSEPNFDTESLNLFDFSDSRGDRGDNLFDYMSALRTIDSVTEKSEVESALRRRKSRLIEALTLSSTSASSLCILDKEREFNPPLPQVPKIVTQTADFITRYALHTTGIFRTGGSKKRVRQMKDDFNNGLSCVITKESNPNDVAELFKDFLRCLPDPLLTRELYIPFLSATQKLDEGTILTALKQLVWLLPVPNQDTLKVVLSCLAKVAQNSEDTVDAEGHLLVGNKMDSFNLATLMAPNILHRCKQEYKNPYQVEDRLEDTKAQIQVVQTLIEHQEDLFRVPAKTHHRILEILLEADPETVDYILRKKAAQRNLHEIVNDPEGNMDLTSSLIDRRSSKVRYSAGDEVAFRKSNSFSAVASKPVARQRKVSSGSRPTSTRSDPPDRSSLRTSSFGTPVSRHPSYRADGDFNNYAAEETVPCSRANRNSCSPRDSGVVLDTTPLIQRQSLTRSLERREMRFRRNEVKDLYAGMLPSDAACSISSSQASPKFERTTSFSKSNIFKRQQSRDRQSRDSAYDSGMAGMFPQRSSEVSSVHFEVFGEDSLEKLEVSNDETYRTSCQNPDVQSPLSMRRKWLSAEATFVSDEHVVKAPNVSPKTPHRKISLPPQLSPRTYSLKSRTKAKSGIEKSNSLAQLKSPATNATVHDMQINWNEDWPHWTLNPRQSQFPTKETDL